ncbi:MULTISPECIES: hypothetical protein [Nocardia]|uniref:hypothetical protein n=1 Tax=Nocardia TaxID=1817 RepID=UPI0002EC4273|nr:MULTISPECIES: hypothetical protein [Nocardia]
MPTWTIGRPCPGHGAHLRELRLEALRTDPAAFSQPFAQAAALSDSDWERRIHRSQLLVVGENSDHSWDGMMGTFIDRHRDITTAPRPSAVRCR